MKVTIEINVPEGPARDEVIGEAMNEARRKVGEALYTYSLEGRRWEHCHAALFNVFDNSLIGHVDLTTKETP